MEDAVEERHRQQGPNGAAVGLGGANERGELPIETVLLGNDPARASHLTAAGAPCGRERHAPARSELASHRAALRWRWQGRELPWRAAPGDGCHGHFTESLLANWLLRYCDGSSWTSARSWPSRDAMAASISAGRRTVSLAGRRRADERGRILRDEAEVDEVGRIIDFDIEILHLDRRLERQREVQREHGRLGIEAEVIVDRRP